MNPESGRRLGPYEIATLLGAGGMGEVYRARDTRLDRLVAIKVLPAHLTANDASRARFEREARAISALSHPNICALYDVGRDGATEYLVMEYLEGQTLADLLVRGPLPRSQFVKLGAQIAEALQHAHRAGIVHRDLKPGNIMITNSGAKLLGLRSGEVRRSGIGTSRPGGDRDAPRAADRGGNGRGDVPVHVSRTD
jgi:serine/threonine protein kinase